MDDTGREPANGGEFLGTSGGMNRLDAHRHVFADGDHMGYFTGCRVAHRDLADHPMLRRTIIGNGLLLDPFDPSGFKGALKFLFQFALRIFCENLKDVAADNRRPRHSLISDFAMTVPTDYSVISIDDIDRNRQRIEHGLGELPVFLFGAVYRIIDRALIMRREVDAHCGDLCRGVDQSLCSLSTIGTIDEPADDRALDFAVDVKR